jgi:hypothetical protein
MALHSGGARDVLDEFADELGWDQNSMILVLCDFINFRNSVESLREFLSVQRDAELEMGQESCPKTSKLLARR